MEVDNYFIKPGYITNPVKTFDLHANDTYWTDQRIRTSEYLQYHVYEYAGRVFREKGFKSIIDIGSGPGLKTKIFFDNIGASVYLMDQPSVEGIAKKIFPAATFIAQNIDKDVSLDMKFDMVLCADVIEHLENPNQLLDLIKGILKKKDGIAIISTPDRLMRRGKSNNQSPNPEHVREWDSTEFRSYLEHHNFSIDRQINLPSIRLHPFKKLFHRILYKKVKQTTWYPCQTISARLP